MNIVPASAWKRSTFRIRRTMRNSRRPFFARAKPTRRRPSTDSIRGRVMSRRSEALALVLVTPVWAQEGIPAPSGEAIVAPDARFEVLYTRPETAKGGLTESPAVAPDGSIYFSDILRGENTRSDPSL